MVSASFEDVRGPREIAVDVSVGGIQQVAHDRLRRQVDDVLGALSAERAGLALSGSEIQSRVMEALARGEPLEPRLFRDTS